MVRIEARYPGHLHCEARHAPSGVFLHTDAPVDNQGRGESFSPTDLVATALGSCLLTTMAIVAQREGIAIEGSTVTVDKEMTTQGPRRISRLIVHLQMAIRRSADPKGLIAAVAQACPVSRSLHPDVDVVMQVDWENE
jgi:putative redox protein